MNLSKKEKVKERIARGMKEKKRMIEKNWDSWIFDDEEENGKDRIARRIKGKEKKQIEDYWKEERKERKKYWD